jgi:hypothetical protein
VRIGVDGTGSGPCPVAGFGINGVETAGSHSVESNLIIN